MSYKQNNLSHCLMTSCVAAIAEPVGFTDLWILLNS